MAGRHSALSASFSVNASILICLLGPFRVTLAGQNVAIARGSKVEALLTYLALHHHSETPRELLLTALWPECDVAHAGQSLNSLVYSIQKVFEQAHAEAAPVVQANGYYHLNEQAGVAVDVALYAGQADLGDRLQREGTPLLAAQAYEQAVSLYRGDLCATNDVNALLEREHLRARYLGVLSWLADHHFEQGHYGAALHHVHMLLTGDACREDAHRLAMRCYVRVGQRAQALRQYHLCRQILQGEFDAEPEEATTALYHQIRLAPGTV